MHTESAVEPLAKFVVKFEMFPPGQAATMIMPSAMDGLGATNLAIRKAIAGRSKNWQTTPIRNALGLLNAILKSASFK